jgi:hypothetical protein
MELARNFLGVTEETKRILGQNFRCPHQDSNLASPEYKSEYLPLAKTCSVRGLFSQCQCGRSFKLISHIHIEQRPLNAFFVYWLGTGKDLP